MRNIMRPGPLASAPLLLCACLPLLSCARSRTVSTIDAEELFTLSYGSFEDEIDMFNLSSMGSIGTSLVMRDGFFYIANGEARKIMELNSYGDLLMLYYNEDHNPAPSFLSEETGASLTRRAAGFPFSQIGAIAVDPGKRLYAVDTLPSGQQETAAMAGGARHALSQVVLRFDPEGNFMDYLGQQGPGGTPFPFISAIYATENSELVVVTRSGDAMVVFWFNRDGYPLYKIPILPQNVPNPYSDTDSWLSMEAVVPGLTERTLFIKVDYFSNYVDEASRIQSGIDYRGTLLYPLDVESGVFSSPLSIPPYSDGGYLGRESYDIPYDFLGVTENNWFFFIVGTESGFGIQMVQGDGGRILTRRVPLDRKENLYCSFSLSREGILSVLLARAEDVAVDWWRTDELILSVLKD